MECGCRATGSCSGACCCSEEVSGSKLVVAGQVHHLALDVFRDCERDVEGITMALGATVHVFTVRLSHVDRAVYETLELRLARHPSESAEYLVTRLLAYCLEFTEGIAFSKGLSDPDEPAIVVRDLTGVLRGWIEVGAPEALRLHKAAKATERVAVYPTRDRTSWLARLAGEHVHRSEQIEIHAIDPALIANLAAKLERRMDFDLSVADQTLYLSLGTETLTGSIELLHLTEEP
jgi:uncharacterized protein YaeQ